MAFQTGLHQTQSLEKGKVWADSLARPGIKHSSQIWVQITFSNVPPEILALLLLCKRICNGMEI